MSQKQAIVSHLIYKIDQQSNNNIALIHYITNNSRDYYIYLTTTDKQHAGKIFEIENENESDGYTYGNLPFNCTNPVYFYFIDDLIEALLTAVKDNNMMFDSIYSPLIKKNYQKEWIHQLCNKIDNFNLLDEL